jgi:hypothetical protein
VSAQPALDLRALAVVLYEGSQAAERRDEESLASILNRMAYVATALHVGHWDVRSDFEDLRSRYGV